MKDLRINGRLLSAAEFVRQGARFADIGTDHAYLPLFLLAGGRVESAICADVNEGPLASARSNAREVGITENIDFVLTDGASALCDRGVTDVAICGMGGELIADIIDRAPFLKDANIRLILGPMSKQAHLRSYLASSGFALVGEAYSEDTGKYYVTLAVEYTGESRQLSSIEAELGSALSDAPLSEPARRYFETKARSLEKAARGKMSAGEKMPDELLLHNKIMEILSNS